MSTNQFLQQDMIEALYEEHHAWLKAWISKKLGCSSSGADLAHDTYVRVLQKDGVPQLQEPRAYLTKIAHDIMVNFLKRRDIERAYYDAIAMLDPQHSPSVEMQAILLETLYEIDTMLHGLSGNVRKAYLMLQLDGMNYAQIAAELKVSVRTVTTYIAKASLLCALSRQALNNQNLE